MQYRLGSATLCALLEGLPEPWLDANEGEGTFSPRDVLGHLIPGERADWIPRLARILESGESRSSGPFDRFGFQGVATTPVEKLVEEFARLRAANLEALSRYDLAAAQMELLGNHPALGRVTIGELLATWAVHDLNHFGQIVRVMRKRYDAAVGPWKAYLGILNR